MNELHDQILMQCARRIDWEQRQTTWYEMRCDGLRRQNKPYPNAPDLHWPLIDGQIAKFKPVYFNMVFQGQRICEFVAKTPELKSQCETAADYFDYQVTECSNFTKEILTVIDQKLLRGRAVMKVCWNPELERLEFRQVDTLYFLTPMHGDVIEDMDWFVDVQIFSVASYLRDPRFIEKDDSTIAQIRGNQTTGTTSGQTVYKQTKYMREGITFSTNADEILVWEVWEKKRGGYNVCTYSPMRPEIKLREDFSAPYKLDGNVMVPYQSFQFEVKDKGWYSPRGLAEKLSPMEAVLCKLENSKLTFIDYIDRPLFTNDDTVPPNVGNVTIAPGSALPKGMKPAIMPPMPSAMAQEMTTIQLAAEQYVSTPTAGLAPDPTKGSTGEKPTATQINYQATVASGQVSMDGKVFRSDLAQLYRKAWAVICFHQPEDLAYFSGQDRKVLPQEALVESYRVIPSGSPDDWDKEKRIQRALARRQTFFGDPRIDQGELDKGVLIADDPRLVPLLYVGDNQKQAMEADKQAYENLLLEQGRQVMPEAQDDHVTHMREIMQRLHHLGTNGVPVNPMAKQRLLEHLMMHMKFLQEMNPQLAGQAKQAIQAMDSQPQGSDQNVTPMPGTQAQAEMTGVA